MTIDEFLPVPPIETATDPIHSPADLRQRWRALMGPLGFGERILWFAFIGPDRCFTTVMSQLPIPAHPTPDVLEFLMVCLSVLVTDHGEGSSVALLLTRSGLGGVSSADRRWSSALTRAAERFGVPIEPVFRANDAQLVLVEPLARQVR